MQGVNHVPTDLLVTVKYSKRNQALKTPHQQQEPYITGTGVSVGNARPQKGRESHVPGQLCRPHLQEEGQGLPPLPSPSSTLGLAKDSCH